MSLPFPSSSTLFLYFLYNVQEQGPFPDSPNNVPGLPRNVPQRSHTKICVVDCRGAWFGGEVEGGGGAKELGQGYPMNYFGGISGWKDLIPSQIRV